MSSYIPIASQTLGSSASSVTFSSIPTTLGGKTLRDLVLVASGSAVGGSTYVLMTLNGSATGYNQVEMLGTGSSALSIASSNRVNFILNAYQPTFVDTITSQMFIQILDYAQTDKHKSLLARNDRSDDNTTALAGRWANTAAVTSIVFTGRDRNFAAGSTFSLFGLEG